MPREMSRVLDLQVRYRVHGRGPPDGVGADLGQADVADIACLDHFGDGATVSSMGTFGSSRAGR